MVQIEIGLGTTGFHKNPVSSPPGIFAQLWKNPREPPEGIKGGFDK